MNSARDGALIDQLSAEPAEAASREFKGNATYPDMIFKCCRALTNWARI
ncbi:hypothetical protein LNV09_10370 [Paucibacter sp. B2R-40]|nr:hypothetical protein [Paucibacter sp. B2R-40]MCV2354567.1 hypothetical protein [Paucibacter sp. B2R-40]